MSSSDSSAELTSWCGILCVPGFTEATITPSHPLGFEFGTGASKPVPRSGASPVTPSRNPRMACSDVVG